MIQGGDWRLMKIPFMVWLFQGLPESIGIATLMYAVAGYNLRWNLYCQWACFLGLFFT